MAFLTDAAPTMQLSIEGVIMNSRWRFTLSKFLVWITAEIVLSMLGIDDLADYSEFIFEKNVSVLSAQELTVK